MAVCLLLRGCSGVVDDGDEPVAIPPQIEDYVAIDGIGILEGLPHVGEMMPADDLDDAGPGFNLTGCVRVELHRFAEVPAGDDMH